MKKVLFVFALLAIGINSFAYVIDDGGGTPGCTSQADSDNGRCVKKTKGDVVEFYCVDRAWYQSANCVK